MKILIAGICGFTGSNLARSLQAFDSGIETCGWSAAINHLIRAAANIGYIHIQKPQV